MYRSFIFWRWLEHENKCWENKNGNTSSGQEIAECIFNHIT